MRRLPVLISAIALIAAAATPALAQINDDPSLEGTTGLFVVPRANTYERGSWALGAGYSVFAREAGDTQIKTLTIMGGYGLTDRLEAFVSFEPRIELDRQYTSEDALIRMMRVPTGPTSVVQFPLNGLTINEHPFAVAGNQNGVGDLRAGLKYKFLGDPWEYDGAALQGWVKFPTADDGDGIGTGELDFGGRLIGSLEAWESVGWNLYLGYLFRADPDAGDHTPLVADVAGAPYVFLPTPFDFFVSDEFQYGVGFHFPTRATLQFVGEWFGVVTSEDMFKAYTGGDDTSVVQAGLRATFDGGLAIGAAANYNTTINVRDPDWQTDADAVDDELRRWGFVVTGSYSTSRRQPLTFAGTSPMDLPPVNRPPTLECRAERTTLRQGESVRLFAETSDPDNDPVTVTWAVSAGTLSSQTGTEVTWGTEGVPPGSGPISARAADGYGGTADCELRVTVEEPPAPPEDVELSFVCSEFPSGNARIDNRCKAVLDDVALQLRQNPGATAVITGHTDDVGSEEANMEAGQERADNAKAYLVDTHGIDASRIEATSAGEGMPMASNDTGEGRAQNRRIEIMVTIPGQ